MNYYDEVNNAETVEELIDIYTHYVQNIDKKKERKEQIDKEISKLMNEARLLEVDQYNDFKYVIQQKIGEIMTRKVA